MTDLDTHVQLAQARDEVAEARRRIVQLENAVRKLADQADDYREALEQIAEPADGEWFVRQAVARQALSGGDKDG